MSTPQRAALDRPPNNVRLVSRSPLDWLFWEKPCHSPILKVATKSPAPMDTQMGSRRLSRVMSRAAAATPIPSSMRPIPVCRAIRFSSAKEKSIIGARKSADTARGAHRGQQQTSDAQEGGFPDDETGLG